MRRVNLLLGLVLFLAGCGAQTVTQSVSHDLSGGYSGCAIGAFVNGMENISSFQTMAGKNLAVVLWYVHWLDSFPLSDANLADANGSVPLITWEPWITHKLGTLEAIAAGSYESYVRSFMPAARDWGKPLLLRFAHEMNGNWYPWSGANNGGAGGAESYKRAWHYLYNVREEVGASNVKLVWCPNNTNVPTDAWNTPEAYYPGDQYVDWIGMDGYNWGYSQWQSFDEVFSSLYSALTSLTTKPLMIGEFASAEEGGDKGGWITDAFAKIKNSYPRIKLFCWFNINKERDWRINSSPTAEAAFKDALRESYFLGTI